jgi:hypothetical protein
MPAHSHYRRFTVAASMTIAAALALTGAPAVAAPTPTPTGDGGAVPQVTPQRRAIELVQPATVLVRTDWKAYVDYGTGRPIPQAWSVVCTGEVVSADGYVVTAGHCLDSGSDGAKRDAIELTVDELIDAGLLNADRRDEVVASVMSGRDRWLVFGKDRDSPPSVETQIQLGGGVASWPTKKDPKDGVSARVIETVPFDDGDVALLKVEETNLPVAQLAPREEAQVGQELLSIGYPFEEADGDQVALTNQNGQINSVDTTGVHGPGNLFYRTSATLSKGMSGGPAVALDGRVLGIASNTRNNKTNFIVPASVVGEVLTRHGVKNELGRVDTLYRTGLDDFYHGYYSDAIKLFDQVAQIVPTHALAKQKSREAADLRQRYGDQARPTTAVPPSRNPVLVWGAIGASAVLLLVLVLLGVRYWRRRRTVAPAVPAQALVGLHAQPYGWPELDDDTHVGYAPLYRAGPYPPASAPPYVHSARPASAPPASAPPASAPPGSGPPVSAPPDSVPPADAPSAGTPPFADAPVRHRSAGPATYRSESADRADEAKPTPSMIPRQSGGFCPTCGAPRGAHDAFCSSCGTRLGAPAARPR